MKQMKCYLQYETLDVVNTSNSYSYKKLIVK